MESVSLKCVYSFIVLMSCCKSYSWFTSISLYTLSKTLFHCISFTCVSDISWNRFKGMIVSIWHPGPICHARLFGPCDFFLIYCIARSGQTDDVKAKPLWSRKKEANLIKSLFNYEFHEQRNRRNYERENCHLLITCFEKCKWTCGE